MDWITDPGTWIAFATLTTLEIVLGIDNIVFISILAGKLPAGVEGRARVVGLSLAMFSRILLLLAVTWLIRLTGPLFAVLGNEISGKDLIMLGGGLFLVGKSTYEMHETFESGEERRTRVRGQPSFKGVIVQIVLLDIVFSLDSVITAVGMVEEVAVMIAAVVVAVGIMLVASGPISRFIRRHPTVKMLSLSFLLLIGMTLIADAFGQHVPKGYIYFAMAFSLGVEILNLQLAKRGRTVPDPVRSP